MPVATAEKGYAYTILEFQRSSGCSKMVLVPISVFISGKVFDQQTCFGAHVLRALANTELLDLVIQIVIGCRLDFSLLQVFL